MGDYIETLRDMIPLFAIDGVTTEEVAALTHAIAVCEAYEAGETTHCADCDPVPDPACTCCRGQQTARIVPEVGARGEG